jgi:hypothetical protein
MPLHLTAADIRYMAQPPLPRRAPQPPRSFQYSHIDHAYTFSRCGKKCLGSR